LIDSTLEIG